MLAKTTAYEAREAERGGRGGARRAGARVEIYSCYVLHALLLG